MKKFLMFFAVMAIMAGVTTRVVAQVTITSPTAGAELVKVLTIGQTTPLYFGKIGITAGTAGTVTMTTAGGRSTGALTTTLINTGTLKTVAAFHLTGTTDAVYTISITSPIVVSTSTGSGTKSMNIDALKVKVDAATEVAAAGATGTLALGVSNFLLSGTLNIATDQELGVYTGTYPVTVDYQ